MNNVSTTLWMLLLVVTVFVSCSKERGREQEANQADEKWVVEKRPSIPKHKLIEAKELCKAYAKNPMSADKKYKGKRFRITGEVGDKGTGLDHFFINLDYKECGCNIKMFFPKKHENYLALTVLDPGKSVTVVGTVSGKDGVINVKNCTLE